MPSELKFNVGMNKTEFMTGSKEVARAIASLKTTVMQAGKSMNSSAVGYGTAMRQYSKVSREASQSIQSIKTRLDSLRQSTTAIKSAADAFRTLQERIKASEDGITKMEEKMSALESSGGKYSQAWQDNQKNIASARAELEKTTNAYHDYDEAVKYAQKRLATGKDEWGHGLTNEERNTYTEEAKYNQEYADKASAQMAKMQANVQALEREEAALIAQGQNLPSEAWQRLQTEIDSARQSVTNMKEELGVMKEKGFENADQTANYNSQVNAVKSLEAALDAAQSKKNELIKPPYMQAWDNMTRLSGMVAEGFGRIQNVASGALYAVTHPIQAIDRALGTVIAKVGQTISSFARMAGSAAVNFLKRLASEARNAAIQLAKMAANAVTSGFKKVASGAAAAAKGVLNFNRAHKGTGDTLKMGLRNILRYAFGIRSMFFLFRRLRAAISEGFGELKKQNPEVKASLDSLSASFNGLKASLASAFAPILTAVAPALTALINMLTAAMNVVAAFMAALGGGKTFSKAVGGIKGVGKSAGGAGKKVKELKRELAGFDELNIINDQNKSGGGGGGGGGGSALKYQTEQIPESIKTFVDTLKKKWEEGDYESVGNLVAQKINGVFESALKLITWENVEDKVEAGVSAVAGVFNGLTDPNKGIKFGQIGTVFSAGVRTLINAIDRLVKKISTANIGIGIANFFNGILDNKALFDDAKQGLQDVTTAVTNLAAAFLQEFNEGTLAQRIRDTLGDSAMWEGIGKEVWNVITLAFNKTGNFLNVLLGGEDRAQDPNVTRMMRQKPKDIVPEFQIDGTVFDDLATNLANGINNALESVTEFISNHSPTNAIYALAGWITKIRNGIHWDVVGKFLGTSFKTVLDGLGAWITEWSQEAETIGGDIATAINGFIDAAFDGDTVADYFTKAVKGAFSLVKGFVEKINEEKAATEIKEAIEGIDWNGIAETAWEAFKTAVSKLGNFLTVLFGGDITPDAENAVDAVEQMWDRHSGKNTVTTDLSAEGLAKTVGGAVSAILEQLDKWITGLDWPEIGAGLHDFLENLPWEDWGQKLATALHDLLTNIDDFISAATFGENYKENDTWRFFHTGKAAEYDVEKAVSSSTNAEDVLKKYGLTEKSFAQLKALADSPIISDPDMLQAVQEAQSKVAAIMAELDGAGITEPIGEASADGLVQGVENKSTDIENAGKDMGAALSGGASDELGINSPSKVFESIGEMVVAGLVNGLNTLPQALKGVWDNLPEWAQTLLGKSVSDFKLAISGGGDGGNGGSNKQSKGQTKEVRKNTKELKKNTKKRSEVDVNYEGAGFDTSSGTPTLNVGVKFKPDGEEASDENTNGGLLGWLQALLDADTLEAKVELVRQGFTTVIDWLSENGFFGENLQQLIELIKAGKWSDVVDWFDKNGFIGPALSQVVELAKQGRWADVLDWFKQNGYLSENIDQLVALVKDGNWTGVIDWLSKNNLFGPKLQQLVELIKSGNWTGVIDWLKTNKLFGPAIEQLVKLVQEKGFVGVIEWLKDKGFAGKILEQLVELGKKDPNQTSARLFGADSPISQTISLVKGTVDGFIDNVLNGKDATKPVKLVGATKVSKKKTVQSSDDFLMEAINGETKVKPIQLKGATKVSKKKTVQTSDDFLMEAVNGETKEKPIKLKGATTVSKKTGKTVETSDDFLKEAVNGETKEKRIKLKGATAISKKTGKTVQTSDDFLREAVNGETSEKNIRLKNSSKSSSTVEKAVNGKSGNVTIGLVVGKIAKLLISVFKALGWMATGGIISSSGKVKRFASGGAIMRNGRASWWNSVNKYAAGTTRAHGTVFVAGEAGPEIMGHVNGRTEILNKSQLADAMYGAVVAGMANAVNALGSYLANRMATCTNAIVQTISANSDISALAGMNYYAPAMATGGIMPYDVAMQISRSAQDIQNTLNANNEDLIQAMVSAMNNAANSIAQVIQRQMLSTGSNGKRSTDAIDVINRQSLMFGKSPLKGV